jgi:hypothetical protein
MREQHMVESGLVTDKKGPCHDNGGADSPAPEPTKNNSL